MAMGMPQKTILRPEVSNRKMWLRGEAAIGTCVIDHGAVMEWTGGGWVFDRPAQPVDYETYPVVVDGPLKRKNHKSGKAQ